MHTRVFWRRFPRQHRTIHNYKCQKKIKRSRSSQQTARNWDAHQVSKCVVDWTSVRSSVRSSACSPPTSVEETLRSFDKIERNRQKYVILDNYFRVRGAVSVEGRVAPRRATPLVKTNATDTAPSPHRHQHGNDDDVGENAPRFRGKKGSGLLADPPTATAGRQAGRQADHSAYQMVKSSSSEFILTTSRRTTRRNNFIGGSQRRQSQPG